MADGRAAERHAPEEYGKFLGWRLGRYADAVAKVKSDDTYDDRYESVRQEDYFHTLASQFVLCLNADANSGNDRGIYTGVVSESVFSEQADMRKKIDAVASP